MTEPFVRPTKEQQLQLALPVLLAARELVLCGVSPLTAIIDVGGGGLAGWYARQALFSVMPAARCLPDNLDRSVIQSDRLRGLDRAIRLARRAFGHRGGWAVSAVAP